MNIAKTPILQDDQKFALMKFRRSVSDTLKPEHDDHYLLRWLRARQWNATAAEKMLRDSIKWRERWGVDEIETWEPPVILEELCPHGVPGFDKEGSPIIVVPFAGFDMWGLLHTLTRSDIIRNTIQKLERYMKMAYEQSKTHGPESRKFIVIFDMSNFYMKQYAWRPAAEVVITLIKMYGLNYPEILKCCYIINAPKVFAFAFNIVKKFLDEYTIGKIHIYKSDQKKWLPAILERVDASQLPKWYGGEMTDVDGNPQCLEKIKWGGKVPKEMYTSKEDSFNNNSSYKEANVKKGGKLKMAFEVTEPGCFLKWDFRTYEADIKFGIRCIDSKSGEIEDEVTLKRVASHQCDETGFINCKPDCRYNVVFDNSYSFFKSKKLTYSVILTTPLSEIENEANEVVETGECDKIE